VEALEARLAMWDNAPVTVTADDKKRVVLPSAKPGDCFDVQASGEGTFVLRRLAPPRSPDAKIVSPIPYKGGWLMPGEVDMDKLTEEVAQERQRRDENLLG
jgi:hypothetical protein